MGEILNAVQTIKEKIIYMEEEAAKFDSGIKAAGARVTKTAQEIKKDIQAVRARTFELRKNWK